MPEVAQPQVPVDGNATPPPVSPADEQRALIARENGTTYDADSQTFAEAPAEKDGATPATPASGEPAQKSATSEAQGDTPTPVEGGGDEGSEGDVSGEPAEPASPGKNHVARKIDKLTKENAEFRRAFAEMQRRGMFGQQQQPQQPQQQPPQAPADPKPDASKYTDVAQFIADSAKWEARQTTRQALGQVFGQLAQQQAAQQQIQQAAAQVHEFNSKVSEGAKEIKDFSQVTAANADVEVASHVATVLMQGVDNPALVLYHLAKNPAEVEKLNQLPPAKVAARLGAIEANAKRAPQISNAPKPGVPVAAKGSAPTGYSDEMTTEQYMEWRNKTARKR